MATRALVTVSGVQGIIAKNVRTVKALTDLTDVLKVAGLKLQDRARKRLLQRPTAQTAKARATATDALADSIHTVVDPGGKRSTTATAVRYAVKQQEGGRIDPVPPKKALAIPMDLTLAKLGAWPRDFPRSDFTFVPSKKARVAGVLKFAPRTEEQAALPIRDRPTAFLLMRFVVLKGQPYLFKTAADKRFVSALIITNFKRSRQ